MPRVRFKRSPAIVATATGTRMSEIRAIDAHSVHRITSGQVVIDLQTAVKELVENSLDAGATSIGTSVLGPSTAVHSVHRGPLSQLWSQDNRDRRQRVRHRAKGLRQHRWVQSFSFERSLTLCRTALKHYTSKLSSFDDLSRVHTFGFRGEALSSLCALTDGFSVTTATSSEAPMGTVIEMDRNGKAQSKCKIARQVCHPVRSPSVPLTHHREERQSRSQTYSSHSLCAEKSLRETRNASFKRH